MKPNQRFVIGVVLVVALLLLPTSVLAQLQDPYADFQAMPQSDLETLQVKLTYVGPQDRVVPTVAFTPVSNTFDLTMFAFGQPDLNYHNDDIIIVGPGLCQPTAAEMDVMIDNVGTLPDVTASAKATRYFMSFMLYNNSPGEKRFEAVLDEADTLDLLRQMRMALANQPDCTQVLDGMASAMGLSPLTPVYLPLILKSS